MTQTRFYAKWEVPRLPVEFDIDEFRIFAGIDSEKDNIEDQVPGYFPHDRDARLTVDRGHNGWFIELSVPTRGLEEQDGYYIVPELAFDEYEASDFGVTV